MKNKKQQNKPTKTTRKRAKTNNEQNHANGDKIIGRSIVRRDHSKSNQLNQLPSSFDQEQSNKPTDLFRYRRFLDLSKSQSYMIYKLMSKLEDRYEVYSNVIINDEFGIGLLNRCVRYKKFVKRCGPKIREKYDQWQVFVSISTASAMLEHFFANSKITRVLINVLNEFHSTGLLIEKNGENYVYTSYDPNHGRFMDMTRIFCKAFNTATSQTRVIRCITGNKNNTDNACFAMSWDAICKCFTGQKCFDSYATQFWYDYISKKKLPQ